jgi:hypothetical protein
MSKRSKSDDKLDQEGLLLDCRMHDGRWPGFRQGHPPAKFSL